MCAPPALTTSFGLVVGATTAVATTTTTTHQIPQLYKREALRRLFDEQFGGPEKIIKDILCDFFKHGFDGGGADNFFDAGCVCAA